MCLPQPEGWFRAGEVVTTHPTSLLQGLYVGVMSGLGNRVCPEWNSSSTWKRGYSASQWDSRIPKNDIWLCWISFWWTVVLKRCSIVGLTNGCWVVPVTLWHVIVWYATWLFFLWQPWILLDYSAVGLLVDLMLLYICIIIINKYSSINYEFF